MLDFILKNKIPFYSGVSIILATYTDLKIALLAFVSMTILDTISKIHYTAMDKKIPFNPFKKCFWSHISSGGLRQMIKKVFGEYGKYLIILFVLDIWVFKNLVKVPFPGREIELPIAGLYFFTFIEIRSICENIGENGGTNWLVKLIEFLPEPIKESYKKVFKKTIKK